MNDSVLSVISLAVGVAGLVFGYLERRARANAQSVQQTQLLAILNRVRAIVAYRKRIEGMLVEPQANALQQWAWTQYKGLSDLYVSVVSYFLALQTCFAYRDLSKLIKAGTVATHWEERVWRDMLALRPENRAALVPDFGTTKDADADADVW